MVENPYLVLWFCYTLSQVSKDTISVIKLPMIELFEAPIIKFIVKIFNGTKWHVALKKHSKKCDNNLTNQKLCQIPMKIIKFCTYIYALPCENHDNCEKLC
jgi:hypothetical protein